MTTGLSRDQQNRLNEINGELDRITNASKSEGGQGGGYVTTPEQKSRFKELVAEAKGIREDSEMQREADEIKRWTNEPSQPSRVANMGDWGGEAKTLGQMFVESAEFKSREGVTMRNPFSLDADVTAMEGGIERKDGPMDLHTASGGELTRPGFGTTTREPMVPRPYQMKRVRDLFEAVPTTSNLIEYIRQRGYLDANGDNTGNNARPVPEREGTGDTAQFGLKPQSALSFESDQAPVRTIAHWQAIHRNTLDDEPQLRNIIDTELIYGLRLAEDSQLLLGDGTGENIRGLFNTPYIQNYPGAATPSPVISGDTYVDAIRRASTRVVLAEYEPTGIVVHPLDWEALETTKDANGNYVMVVSVANGGDKRIWTMPVISTPAIPQGTALVGAFGLGAKVYDRQVASVRTSDQDRDNFVRNAVTLLAENRLALTVQRPEAFVMVDLAAGITTTTTTA